MIIHNKGFSYGFDPNFQERYFTFWKGFLADPLARLIELKNDPVLFIEMCCQTASRDPRSDLLSIKQFELMPVQKKYVTEVYENVFLKQKSAVLLKSRQQGASWLNAAIPLYIAIFYPHQVILMTTRDKEILYKMNDPMSLMGKVEFMFDHLPKVFKKQAITYSKFVARHFSINKSIIKGAFGREAGRSATATLTINDEFDFNPNQKAMLSSMKNACKANIFLSTLNQPGSEFDRMRESSAYIQLRLSWLDDLRIGDKEKFKADYIALNGRSDFDREIDMKHSAENEMYVFEPEWIPILEKNEFKRFANYPYPIVAGFDVAAMGSNFNVLWIRKGPEKLAVLDWNQTTPEESYHYIMQAFGIYHFQVLVYDEIGVGYSMTAEFARQREIPFLVAGLNVGSSGQDKEYNVVDFVVNESAARIFVNLRARLYWYARERIRKTVQGTAEPWEQLFCEDPQTLKEMTRLTYETDGGKTKIISKKDLKRKKIKSPDFLDAFVYTLYAEEIAQENYIGQQIYR